MNFDYKIEALESELKGSIKNLESLKSEYKKCKLNTEKLLSTCGKAGIEKVSIGMRDDSIPSCKGWPFAFTGSVFTLPVKGSDWPAIWSCVRDAGFEMGCGNSDQASIDPELFVDGVYELKKGKWIKIR